VAVFNLVLPFQNGKELVEIRIHEIRKRGKRKKKISMEKILANGN
jgi:hypothetical protein